MVPEPGSGLRQAYDEWHGRLEVDAESDTPWHRLVKQHLDAQRDLDGKLVLEIGSGRGGLAHWLATHETRPSLIVAADFAATAVRVGRDFVARTRGNQTAWAVSDIQWLPHAEGTFDTVVSCETIEHVADPRRALGELRRVLKPGGRLFLTTPNYLGPIGLYRIYLRATGRRYTEEGQPLNHPLLLPRTVGWVRRAGLRVERIDAVGHYLPIPGRPPVEHPRFNEPRRLMRWFGLHSLVVAVKPRETRDV